MEPQTAKIFYLKKRVLFPFCTLPVFVRSTDESTAIRKGDQILAFSVRSLLDIVFHRGRLATLAEVTDVQKDDQSVRLTIRGLARATIQKIFRFRTAEFMSLEPREADLNNDLKNELRKKSQEVIFLINVEESDKLIRLLNYIVDLNQMTDFIANYFIMDFRTRFRLYRETDVARRGRMLMAEMSALIRTMTGKNKRPPL